MSSSVLWQSPDGMTTLLDIPRSIEAAQGVGTESPFCHLLSTPAIHTPFPSNEPKSADAKSKLTNNTVDATLHVEYQRVLEQALDNVRNNFNANWCLPRPFTEGIPSLKKRKSIETSDSPDSYDGLAGAHLNTGDKITLLQTKTDVSDAASFRIPPGACCYLGDCADSKAFHSAVQDHAQRAESRKSFDLILLDPPWPNRSVKRTHKTKGSTYATSPSLWDLREMLLDMKLDLLMADTCLVAMWITNKPAVRELVLREDGLFACWGVDLVEEWLWLKTTIHGEPVSPLDALWRKPYEVLLLGRRRWKATGNGGASSSPEDVQRRVIISVPDLHSRKPCLKEVIEPLMDNAKAYRALEVFARHLVVGWWSWGDECVKFNWDGYWRAEPDATTCAQPAKTGA